MKTILEITKNTNSRSKLTAMGWSDFFQEEIDFDYTPARVVSVNKDIFQLSQGEEELQATLSGRIRYKAGLPGEGELFPVTGDWVLIEDSRIIKVLPRRNVLSRGASGGRGKREDQSAEEQVMAANLDTVLIVCGLDRDYNVRRIERYLTLVYNCNLAPVVVLSKGDLHAEPLACVEEIESVAFSVPVHLVSANDETGILELEKYLTPGKTVSMVGSSGAGKSTLLNRLYGQHVQDTGCVSKSVGKGMHTTTGRDLIVMPQGGMLIDNPGIREIAFYTNNGGAAEAFVDIEDYARHCRFADCDHLNDPGCNVLRAAAQGELSPERLESYYKMKRELNYITQRRNKSADRVEKERWREIALQNKKLKKRNKNR